MLNQAKYRIHLCFGPNCSQFNPKDLLRALEEEVRAQGLEEDVSIQLSACRQRCEQSPSLNVYPGPVLYNRLTPEELIRIGEEIQKLFEPYRERERPPEGAERIHASFVAVPWPVKRRTKRAATKKGSKPRGTR